jgi:hypothetical protein
VTTAPECRLSAGGTLDGRSLCPEDLDRVSAHESVPAGVRLDLPGAARVYDDWRPEGCDDLFLDEPERCPGDAVVGRKPYVSAA